MRVSSRCLSLSLAIVATVSTLIQFSISSLIDRSTATGPFDESKRCAIHFFGLPRAFSSLVLPSIKQNVIEPNERYGCDYFIHYYVQTAETAGRSGGGGAIDPHQVLLLSDVVKEVSPTSEVDFISHTEEQFWEQYRPLTQKIRNTNHTDGRPLYFPWKAKTYHSYSILDNIVKMWHSIEQSWKLMEHFEDSRGRYERVAMLRVDVVYLTPIDLYKVHLGKKSHKIKAFNSGTIFPAFGRFPVNDRSIIGPREAVKVWATHRFPLLEEHVHKFADERPGWGMHSEKFVGWTLIPLIRQAGGRTVDDDEMCFIRARADESVWLSDCSGADRSQADPHIMEALGDIKVATEKAIGRPCHQKPFKVSYTARGLWCPVDERTGQRPREWAPRNRQRRPIV